MANARRGAITKLQAGVQLSVRGRLCKEDYQPAPYMKGYVEVDGLDLEPEPESEEATDRFMRECIADGIAYEVVEKDAKF